MFIPIRDPEAALALYRDVLGLDASVGGFD